MFGPVTQNGGTTSRWMYARFVDDQYQIDCQHWTSTKLAAYKTSPNGWTSDKTDSSKKKHHIDGCEVYFGTGWIMLSLLWQEWALLLRLSSATLALPEPRGYENTLISNFRTRNKYDSDTGSGAQGLGCLNKTSAVSSETSLLSPPPRPFKKFLWI